MNALTSPTDWTAAARVDPPLHPDVAAWLAGVLAHPEDEAAEAFTDMQEDEG
tara:strand:+ start:44927 stop:45082 length:156 start_codon:yes stop_codon:yes gene_type:complete